MRRLGPLPLDVCLVAVASVALLMVLIELDAFEWFYEVSRAYEHWELDELVLLMPAIALFGCAMALLRQRALKREMTAKSEALTALDAAYQELMRLRKQQDDFTVAITSELRAPMHHVMSSLDLLHQAKLPADEDVQALAHAKQAATQLHTQLEMSLEFTRLQTRTWNCQDVSFSPADLCRSLYERFQQQAVAEGTTLGHQAPSSLPEVVSGCETALHRAGELLLDNALKFAKGKGVTVGIAVQEGQNGHRLLHLDVVDTGPGISAEMRDKLFLPFTQGHGGIGRPHAGLGIGLAMVKQLADAVHGEILFEAQPDQGTRFIFRMPVRNGP